ncbi:glutamate racemase [Brevibacillus ginsengisoli]|uniref:glutamate racemase n=1 Tax=Brevibacillus ginsengisoli TaxID=363854 RepID=UPI003CF5D9D6
MDNRRAIGIIDSGVGGLTVAKEVIRQLPLEQIVYFGDNARCPYGPRSPEEIQTFTNQMIQFVSQFHLKALVIACNTATAVALGKVKAQATLPIIGVIEPGARTAIMTSRSSRIGIIGTETTIRTGAYERALYRINPDLYVVGLACPEFVPLVENQLLHTPEAKKIVADTLKPLCYEELDTLILGCTHYPLLAPLISEVMGDSISIISSAEETARELSTILSMRNLHNSSFTSVNHRFFTSGDADIFREIGEEWLGFEIEVTSQTLEEIFQV